MKTCGRSEIGGKVTKLAELPDTLNVPCTVTAFMAHSDMLPTKSTIFSFSLLLFFSIDYITHPPFSHSFF